MCTEMPKGRMSAKLTGVTHEQGTIAILDCRGIFVKRMCVDGAIYDNEVDKGRNCRLFNDRNTFPQRDEWEEDYNEG